MAYKSRERDYRTPESEKLNLLTAIYSAASIILILGIYKFCLKGVFAAYPAVEVTTYSLHIAITVIFLIVMYVMSSRRAQINRLYSDEVLQVCEVIKECKIHSTTVADFNKQAMITVFGINIANTVPAIDYFSYLFSEGLIEISSVIDIGLDVSKNEYNLSLSAKGNQLLEIYEKAKCW